MLKNLKVVCSFVLFDIIGRVFMNVYGQIVHDFAGVFWRLFFVGVKFRA